MDDEAQAQISQLEIREISAPNWWIAAEQDFEKAEKSELSPELVEQIAFDVGEVIEGETIERWARVKRRCAWLANQFAMDRKRAGSLVCDVCGFDPSSNNQIPASAYRSCFDVHHKIPLAEGRRLTTKEDFALLCPTCHRVEHLLSN